MNDCTTLEQKLDAWKAKVLASYGESGVDTFQMIYDVDKIIAEAFDRDPVIS